MTGPPCWICRRKMLTTLPRLPRTLPKRTHENLVSLREAMDCTTISASRLVAPITLDGRTALSVEIMTKDSTPCCAAISASCRVPNTLLCTAL